MIASSLSLRNVFRRYLSSGLPSDVVISVDRSRLLGMRRGVIPVISDADTAATLQAQRELRAAVGDSVVSIDGGIGPVLPLTTPLQSLIQSSILARGPLSVADFMSLALGHPLFGYYKTREAIGVRGDFITSPEISQLFGDLVGLWVISTLSALKSNAPVLPPWSLIELGPGRGTLTLDILRLISRFPSFAKALTVIRLVETSPRMRDAQATALGVILSPQALVTDAPRGICGPDTPLPGVIVEWYDEIKNIPNDDTTTTTTTTPILIAHELFDALPIHQFVRRPEGWQELLVDVVENKEDALRNVIASGPTAASIAFTTWLGSDEGKAHSVQTRPSSWQEGEGGEGRVLRGGGGNGTVGDVAEFCPIGLALAAEMSRRVAAHRGAALIIDYGREGASHLSVRGIAGHRFVDFLSAPGHVDLSADVDFTALSMAAVGGGGGAVTVLGPVAQGEFLQRMGLAARLARAVNAKPEEKERLEMEAKRLAHPDEMGGVYKAVAIVHSDVANAVPGFGEV